MNIKLSSIPKRILSIVGIFMFTVIVGVGSIPVYAQQRRAEPKMKAPGETREMNIPELRSSRPGQPLPSFSLKDNAGRLVQFSDQVRTSAAVDLDMAIATFGSAEFRADWDERIAPYFDRQEMNWQDFFLTSIFFGGRIEAYRGVGIFYNPWSDTALIAGIDFRNDMMTEFFVVPGERLRGEQVNASLVTPAWQNNLTHIETSADALYAKTDAAIAKLFPLQGAYKLLPGSLETQVSNQEAELALVKARMIARAAMLQELKGTSANAGNAQMKQLLNSLSSAIKRDDKASFERLVSGAQDPRMTDVIFEWPERSKARLEPVFIRPVGEGKHVAALVSSKEPLWFVTARIVAKADGQPIIESARIYKFGISQRSKASKDE